MKKGMAASEDRQVLLQLEKRPCHYPDTSSRGPKNLQNALYMLQCSWTKQWMVLVVAKAESGEALGLAVLQGMMCVVEVVEVSAGEVFSVGVAPEVFQSEAPQHSRTSVGERWQLNAVTWAA